LKRERTRNGDATWSWLLEVIIEGWEMQHGDAFCAGIMVIEMILLVSVGKIEERKARNE
jgi:hypothetical protein